jgi:hypothetical protein
VSEQDIQKILNNAKTSMEIEGFEIDHELEETGRMILSGELNVDVYVADYIARYMERVARQNV